MVAAPPYYPKFSPLFFCFYPLPLKSLASVMKAAKISGYLFLRDSSDPVIVADNCPTLKTEKWSVEDAVKVVESELAFRNIMGMHQQGCGGLGLSKLPVLPY